MPKVTVYIPAYNYGRFIDRAIQSVLKQAMSDWELLVIDDGSKDDTMDKLFSYKQHPKIKIIEQENKGLNVTNNIALRLSNSNYLIRLDADDYFDENILLVLSNILDTKPEVGLVYPDYYHIDEKGEILEIVRRKNIEEEVELLDLPAHGACTMIRKQCLLDIKGYEEEFLCQDGYDLWLKFIKMYRPYNVNIPLFYYRQHSGNMTKRQEKILETRGKIKKRFVDRHNNGERPKVLGIIPVLLHPMHPQSEPFIELAGRPLIWYTLNEALKSGMLDKIVVSSESSEVLDYARQFPNVIPIERPDTLTRLTSKLEHTAIHALEAMKKSQGYEPEAVCILYITTPLRKACHIDKAVDTFTIFDVDSVVSIQEELSHCYFHGRFGLRPINRSRELRMERNAIFKENGAVFITKADIIRKGRLLGQKIGHITMLPSESIALKTDYDMWLAERLLEKERKKAEKEAGIIR